MILVDVEVPVMGQTYDFQVDEDALVRSVASELKDMICLQRQCSSVGPEDQLTLWDANRMLRLPPEQTIGSCGIRTGMRLLLV